MSCIVNSLGVIEWLSNLMVKAFKDILGGGCLHAIHVHMSVLKYFFCPSGALGFGLTSDFSILGGVLATK